MDPDRWQRINDIFHDLIAHEGGNREARLAEACAGEDALRAAVERLLRAHDRATLFLETPAIAHTERLLSTSDPPTAVARYFSRFHVGGDFGGTERFTVRRRLGAGGMGVVYAAHDRHRDEVVALKTLLHATAADIYRLKREFRSLADIAHPNLVCLHELFVDADNCFFTMELVDGTRISDYVRRGDAAPGESGPSIPDRVDPDRLVSALQQLASGLLTLHAKGKLHRDVKPSNVLVTSEGRVVILDFGLTSDVGPRSGEHGDELAGTPAYLAPEQHIGAPPSEATDWYSVGVTLYEALTGRLPFSAPPHELGLRKAHGQPVSPDTLDGGAPASLSQMCLDLLHPDPTRRLSGQEVLERLRSVTPPRHARVAPAASRRATTFVGRTRELEILHDAIAALAHRRSAALCVHGPSGIGKTALVQHALDRAESKNLLVLRGRCYEHEFVPFKALDGVVDSLSAFVRGLPRDVTTELLPPDVPALARAFPVMLQVAAVALAHRQEAETSDPLAQRRAAFTALRTLLARIAERRPLVIYVDDLHWADQDSAQLLDGLLHPPDPPPLLLLVCLRTDEVSSKPYLRPWLDGTSGARCTAVEVAPMSAHESSDVIRALLPSQTALGRSDPLDIAREARGNPYLLEQLAYHVADHAARLEPDATLAEMLRQRCDHLPAGARRFLEVLALCGRPMAAAVVHQAAGLTGDERRLVASLRADHLVRTSGSIARVETYHDRIRETLADRLPSDDARAIHAALVRTLTAKGVDDPDALFEHCRGAGDLVAASHHASLAARKARAALAFDRAASLYRGALELAPASPAAGEWREGLADALMSAGRPREAAEMYLEAAHGADRSRQVELQRRAAEQFLTGGYIDRGEEVTRAVLAAVDMRLPRGPLTAAAGLVWRRARIRWRGLEGIAREAAQIPAETLLRIDTCWSVVTGLALVDTIRAAEFNTRHVLLALEAGEPYRLVRALALEASFLASDRTQSRQTALCVERARALAQRSGEPHAQAMIAMMIGTSALMAGEWKNATVHCKHALRLLREKCSGVTWEVNLTETFHLGSLLYQGEIREVVRRVPALLVDAKERGNLSFEIELRTRMNTVWLAADQPDEGERQANEAMDSWPRKTFQRQHYNHTLARLQTALYRGGAEAAWQLVASQWQGLERALLLRVPYLRIEACYLRGRAALLMAASRRDSRRFLAIARADAHRISRTGIGWSTPVAALLTATAAHLEGNDEEAREHLAAAADGFEHEDMHFHAAIARRRLGQLESGDGGRALVQSADAWLTGQDIVSPARIARLIAPGFAD
jgi:hypothetical protein